MLCESKKSLPKDLHMSCLTIFEFLKFRESENKSFYRFKIAWTFIYGGLDTLSNSVCVHFTEVNYH